MNKKVVKVLSLAAVAGLVLTSTACAAGTATGSKSNELVFWSVFTGPDGENMNQLVKAYNATNPEYPVKHVPVEQNDLYAKIPTVVGSGKDVPDITIMHAERIASFANKGVVQPLGDYIEANGDIEAENYIPEAWNVGTYENEQYSIPLDIHSFVTYYNEDLVNQYAPEILDDNVITFEEMVTASEKAKADDIKGMGITWMRPQFLSYLAQLDGQLSVNGNEPTLETAEAKKVLESVAKLVADGNATQDGDDPNQLFASGQLMFWPEGTWMVNSLKDVPNLNWGMTHMPTLDANNVKNWTSSHQFTMLKNDSMTAERAEGVMDFINWVGENSLEWAKAGQVPAQLSIKENAEFQEMSHSFLMEDTTKLVISDYIHYGYAVEALDKIIYEVVFGRMTADDALAQIQKEVSEKIQIAQ